MTVKENTKILFGEGNDLTIKEIVGRLDISKQMAHIVVNQLMEEGYLEKLGRAPKTVYRLAVEKLATVGESSQFLLREADTEWLRKEFVIVTDSGNLLEGSQAFAYWCEQRKLPFQKTFREFKATKEKYREYYDPESMVNGLAKLKNTKGYDHIWLDDLYYLDFYAIERFGKTKLGNLLHYAKQGQNKFLMKIMMEMVSSRIKTFLESHNADAVGFVPPTIRREVQIMKFIQNQLNLSLPIIDIKKVSGIIPVPQKSLSKLEERIRNARNTFVITDRRSFDHVVLIDDAVGSGSTLNEIAAKIKNKGVAHKITGLAIVGSFKGFDVITDV